MTDLEEGIKTQVYKPILLGINNLSIIYSGDFSILKKTNLGTTMGLNL